MNPQRLRRLSQFPPWTYHQCLLISNNIPSKSLNQACTPWWPRRPIWSHRTSHHREYMHPQCCYFPSPISKHCWAYNFKLNHRRPFQNFHGATHQQMHRKCQWHNPKHNIVYPCHLWQHSGPITEQNAPEDKKYTYIHADPISNVFNIIHEYTMMSKYQGTPETPQQLIGIGKIITTKATIFTFSVEKCNIKLAFDQTWANFKQFFTTSSTNYNKTLPTDTTNSHGYSIQANVVKNTPSRNWPDKN